jgi:hypothetical protein
MPTKRRRRSRHRVVSELPPACWRHLCDLALPGDEQDGEMVEFEYFDAPMSIEAA